MDTWTYDMNTLRGFMPIGVLQGADRAASSHLFPPLLPPPLSGVLSSDAILRHPGSSASTSGRISDGRNQLNGRMISVDFGIERHSRRSLHGGTQ